MVDVGMTDAASIPFSLRTRFKISELPLVKEQRSAIDSLLLKFKKQGGYDSLRRQVWASYDTSEAKLALTEQIHSVAEEQIENDPSLLGRERGKAATLIQGALDRSGVYQDVESRIDAEVAKHLDAVIGAVREIRAQDVGEEQAGQEEMKGGKTDDEYRAETDARVEERAKNRSRMEELARQTAELKAKIRASEFKKMKEEQAKKEEEERLRLEKEAEVRREERRKRREEEDRREAERIKARDERAKKREDERKAREEEYEKERQDRRKRREQEEREHRSSSRRESVVEEKKDVEEKDLEATALELLLSEGKQLADKSKERPAYDFDKSRRRDRSKESRQLERRSRSRDRKADRDTKRSSIVVREIRRSSVFEKEKSKEESPDREEGEARSRKSSRSPSKPGLERKETGLERKEPGLERKDLRDRRPRSASPLGIDRYVPGGGMHRSEEERKRDQERRREREQEQGEGARRG